MLAVLARNGNRQHGHVRVVGGGRNAVIILHLLPRAHHQGLSKVGRKGNLLLFKVPHLPLCLAMVLRRAQSATQEASRSQALIRAERAPNTEQASTSPVVLNQAANDDDEREGRVSFVEGSSRQAAAAHNVRSQDGQISRYIGDLNPESIFLAATSPDATRGASLDDSIGVWLTSTLSRRGSQSTPSMLQSPSSLFYASGSVVQKVLLPILEQESLATIPASATLETLSKIYFERVHPIFPVIDLTTYENLSLKDPARILLQQGICLAASKNFAARQHLVLTESESPLSCRTFGERLSGAMRLIIEIGLVKDKIVLIQALALMSQFIDNPVGDDMSPQLCGRAVHHVQTLGLHLKRQQEDEMGSYNTTLLCCIYSIDRMNAAFHGRPTLMHE